MTGIAYRLIQGEVIDSENPYAWLRTFDAYDLKDFVEENLEFVASFFPMTYGHADCKQTQSNDRSSLVHLLIIAMLNLT